MTDKISDLDEIFEFVTIPIPKNIPKYKGIRGTGQFGESVKTRLNITELELIKSAAKTLGISRSMFIRATALHAARIVERHHVQQPEPVRESSDSEG